MLDPADQDDVAIIEIGNTIQISKTFPTGVGAGTLVLTQELSVEGIEHRINVNDGHKITLYTAPTTIVSLFVLDSSQLDGPNVLG